MELSVSCNLKLGHEEANALNHLLDSLSRDKKKELGLNEKEITVTEDLYDEFAPFFESDE